MRGLAETSERVIGSGSLTRAATLAPGAGPVGPFLERKRRTFSRIYSLIFGRSLLRSTSWSCRLPPRRSFSTMSFVSSLRRTRRDVDVGDDGIDSVDDDVFITLMTAYHHKAAADDNVFNHLYSTRYRCMHCTTQPRRHPMASSRSTSLRRGKEQARISWHNGLAATTSEPCGKLSALVVHVPSPGGKPSKFYTSMSCFWRGYNI